MTSEDYRPTVTLAGAKPHPTTLAETAAMASVGAPEARYLPNPPKPLVTSGRPSDPQLTNIILAGQAHTELLPDGTTPRLLHRRRHRGRQRRADRRHRAGQLAPGRKKAVWISENQKRYNDALRDLTEVFVPQVPPPIRQKI